MLKRFKSLGWRKLLHARSTEHRYSHSQVDMPIFRCVTFVTFG